MVLLFWCSIVILLSAYILYPICIFALSVVCKRDFLKNDATPSVLIVIAAFNEERHIAGKIENTLALDYPSRKMKIVVGSDGSTDSTASIVRGFADKGVVLREFIQNRGKTAVQNDCVQGCSSEIIVFMDAASLCDRDALRKIVRNFSDRRVGAVSGRVCFTSPKKMLVTESQNLYWAYEIWLKSHESELGALIGVDGPLYGIRRDLYRPLHHAMISDFIMPLQVRREGFAVVLEGEARTYEQATLLTQQELTTRKRTTLRAFCSLFHMSFFNPIKAPVLFLQIIIRKVFRWLGGIPLIGIMTASAFLRHQPFYLLVFLASCAFIVTGVGAAFCPKRTSILLKVPYYFLLVNLAGILGFIDFLRGKQIVNWYPVRPEL